MNVKEFLRQDLNAEKLRILATIKDSATSEEVRNAAINRLEAIDQRLQSLDEVDESNDALKSISEIKNQVEVMADKMKTAGVKLPDTKSDYLSSKNAIADFAEAMREAGKGRTSFCEAWSGKLSKNGITIESGSEAAFLPTPVKSYIEDAWKNYGEVLQDFNITGAKAYYARYTEQSQDDTDVRAKGHNNPSGNSRVKISQDVTLAGKLIQSDFVYKMIPVSNKTIWEDDASLIQWVLDELLKQWHYEILRAILIGDGRLSSANDKIYTIESIAEHNGGVSDSFVEFFNTAQSGESTLEFIMDNLISPIDNGDNDIDLFVSKADFAAMRKKLVAAGGTPEYMSKEELASAMGVKRLVVVDFLDNSTYEAVRAIAVHTKKYAVTGSLSPEFKSWEKYDENDTYYRVEIPVGGAVAGLEAAVVMVNPEEPEP